MCGSTCFRRLTAHHQEHTTALGASGLTVGEKRLERCWSWPGRFSHNSLSLHILLNKMAAIALCTTNNAPAASVQRLNQRLLVQLYAPDDGRGDARNMLSHTYTSSNKLVKLLHLDCWFIWNRMMMHGIANVKSLYMFRTVFPSIVRSSRLYIQHQVYVIQVIWLLASGHEMESRAR